MRRVDRESDLESAFRNASSEAERAFRSAEIYVERLIERSRHIEIQLLGDRHGNMVHLGERECSIQRRHQKVIEECPSPLVALHPEMRHEMGQAAIRAARAAGYYNAGTVEFLVDSERRFYFLEMNTRLQVEHPVTELVTGLDLVRLQMEIAAGATLPFTQEEMAWRGAAIECRMYAEDPLQRFSAVSRQDHPALRARWGPGIRLDGCVYDGWTVPMEYDPLLAKLAVWADTREHATARMIRALREYDVGGIHTNLAFFRQILEDAEFRAAKLHTGFIDEFFQRRRPDEASGGFGRRGCVGGRAAQCGAQDGGRQWNGAGGESVADRGKGRAAAMKLALTIDGRADTIEILAPRAGVPLPTGRCGAARCECGESRAGCVFGAAGRPQLRCVRGRHAGGAGGDDRRAPVRSGSAGSAAMVAEVGGRGRGRGAVDSQSDARQGGAGAGRGWGRGGGGAGHRGGGGDEDAE